MAPPGWHWPGTDCHFADSAPTPALASTPAEHGGAASKSAQAPGGPAHETRGAAREGAGVGTGAFLFLLEEVEEGGAAESGREIDHDDPAAGVTRRTTAVAAFALLPLLPPPLAVADVDAAAASSQTGSQFLAAASFAIFPLKTVRFLPPGTFSERERPVQVTTKEESGIIPLLAAGAEAEASPPGAEEEGANQRASTVF